MIHRRRAISRYQLIEAHRQDVLGFHPARALLAADVVRGEHATAEAHDVARIRPRCLPDIVQPQPGAGRFALRAIGVDGLREDAVIVSGCRNPSRGTAALPVNRGNRPRDDRGRHCPAPDPPRARSPSRNRGPCWPRRPAPHRSVLNRYSKEHSSMTDRAGIRPTGSRDASPAPAPRAAVSRASERTVPRARPAKAHRKYLAASRYRLFAKTARQAVVNHCAQRPAPQDRSSLQRRLIQHSNYLSLCDETFQDISSWLSDNACKNYVGGLDRYHRHNASGGERLPR
jgi:hypothetical protein